MSRYSQDEYGHLQLDAEGDLADYQDLLDVVDRIKSAIEKESDLAMSEDEIEMLDRLLKVVEGK